MANLEAGLEAVRSAPADAIGLEDLFRARYLEMVRLAGLLGADDPEDQGLPFRDADHGDGLRRRRSDPRAG
jgi:hypothetical protein